MSKNTVKIARDERWFFCGTTGYGKSYLAKYILDYLVKRGHRVVIFDGPEHGFLDKKAKSNNRGLSLYHPRITTRYLRSRSIRVQMFQPGIRAYASDTFRTFLADVMKDENLYVYFDELVGLVDQNHCPEEFEQLFVQGRKRNICAMASCQRPSRMPLCVKEQCNNWCIFHLQGIDDRALVSQYTGTPDMKDTRLPERYFWYYNLKMPLAQLYPPIGN